MRNRYYSEILKSWLVRPRDKQIYRLPTQASCSKPNQHIRTNIIHSLCFITRKPHAYNKTYVYINMWVHYKYMYTTDFVHIYACQDCIERSITVYMCVCIPSPLLLGSVSNHASLQLFSSSFFLLIDTTASININNKR